MLTYLIVEGDNLVVFLKSDFILREPQANVTVIKKDNNVIFNNIVRPNNYSVELIEEWSLEKFKRFYTCQLLKGRKVRC